MDARRGYGEARRSSCAGYVSTRRDDGREGCRLYGLQWSMEQTGSARLALDDFSCLLHASSTWLLR